MVWGHVLCDGAAVAGGVLSITLQKEGKWSKLLLHIVCVCQLWVCVYLRGADMYLETLITSVNQQGC